MQFKLVPMEAKKNGFKINNFLLLHFFVFFFGKNTKNNNNKNKNKNEKMKK
jgi:hypothetical protein